MTYPTQPIPPDELERLLKPWVPYDVFHAFSQATIDEIERLSERVAALEGKVEGGDVSVTLHFEGTSER